MSIKEDIAYWRTHFHIKQETDMKWTEGSGGYENPPPGSHLSRCYSLIDLGTQITSWQGHDKKVRQVRLSFELPYAKMKGEYNPELAGLPFVVHLTCTQSLHEKAKLRKMLEGWRGKRFTPGEIETFDPRNILGKPARLSLIESESGYINIDGISPVAVEEEKKLPRLQTPTVYFSLEEFDPAVFEKLTEKTKEKIRATPEWRDLWADHEEPPEDDPEPEPSEEESYEDIPF